MFLDFFSQLCFGCTAIPRVTRGIWDNASTASVQPSALLIVAVLVLLVGLFMLIRITHCRAIIQDDALKCTRTKSFDLLVRRQAHQLYTIIISRIVPDGSEFSTAHDHIAGKELEKQMFSNRANRCTETQPHAAGGAKRRERGRSRRGPILGDRQSRARAAARRLSSLNGGGQCDAADISSVSFGKIDPVVIASTKPRKYRPAPIGQKTIDCSGSRMLGGAADDGSGVWSGSPMLGLSGCGSSDSGEAYGLQSKHGSDSDTATEQSFSLFSSSFLE